MYPEIFETSGLRSLRCDPKQVRAQIESRNRPLLAQVRCQTDRRFSGSTGYIQYVHAGPRLRIFDERIRHGLAHRRRFRSPLFRGGEPVL